MAGVSAADDVGGQIGAGLKDVKYEDVKVMITAYSTPFRSEYEGLR